MSEFQRLRIVLLLTPGCAPAIVRELNAAGSVRRVERDTEAALALRGGAQILVTDKDCWSEFSSPVRGQLRERRKAGLAKIIVLADRGIRSTLKNVYDIDLVLAFDEPPQRLTDSLYRLVATTRNDRSGLVPPAMPLSPAQTLENRSRRLLIVDDSVLNNRIVTAVLSQAGYQVSCLTNAFEMRTWVQENSPDLVLVDYNMPALRGDRLIEINSRSGLNVPMVLYTNATQAAVAAVATQCGAIGYILKGVPWEALLERLEQIFTHINQSNRLALREP